jgi:dipeptidyl aminopeptidase/acylaminoacyl peptidase
MTVDDLLKFKRVADPQISPDGKLVVYTLTTVDLAGNKSSSNLWLAATDGQTPPRQLTSSEKKDRHARWSPDGKQILFESTRSGESQLWVIALDGGEAKQLTTISTEAANAQWSPDGKLIAFVSTVYPEFSEKPFAESNEANKKKKEEVEKSPVKAKVFTKLFYRHWDSWVEDKRQHLFVMPAPLTLPSPPGVGGRGKGEGGGGEPRDVTPGDRDSYPTSSTFETGDNFTFSPDSKYLVFTAVPEKNEAWSTNYSICRVPVTGGTKEWECLTKDNPAASSGPAFSPDGKKLAYRVQRKPGFEADRWRLVIVDSEPSGAFRGQPKELTQAHDSSVDEFAWRDDKSLLFALDALANKTIVQINLNEDGLYPISGTGAASSISVSRDGATFAFSHATLMRPAEVVVKRGLEAQGSVKPLTHVNDDLLAQIEMQKPETVELSVAGGVKMQMWIIKPPGFDPSKKYPLAYLVHGGPQGAWEDGWSFRWCPELWAAQGYVVALPNPRGSTGFGQKYVEEISGDWGGKCFDDLMAGVEYMEKQPYIDKDRMAAAGASFGGYMMNWFQGHTTKFKTLICHCGVFNFDSMYATTDEIWFDEWEHGGTPWEKREAYEKHSPHRFAKNFKTPMLIIQNDLDFRCPVAEGFQMFSTLQRLGIPSKMINFPDEGHWVLKPANSQFWHKEVFAWLTKYVPPGAK